MTLTAHERLRTLLAGPEILTIPTCFDALSARVAHGAGFPAVFMSGFGVAAARFGVPDIGLVSFGEMVDQLRSICSAVPGMIVFADADTGFGNAVNVTRTVVEYAKAGAACIMIEDQISPKRCGHFDGKQVVSREEARMKVRAAVDAARGAGILVLARTDARAVAGFDEALQRCRDFEAEGADIVFLEAPYSVEELAAFARGVTKPAVANMVTGGKTPVLAPRELADVGVRIALYHPLLFSAVEAMRQAAQALRREDVDALPPMATMDDIKALLDTGAYDALRKRYAA
jgi:2-methylisocitrate lyase-like PEP mutase family enzyme